MTCYSEIKTVYINNKIYNKFVPDNFRVLRQCWYDSHIMLVFCFLLINWNWLLMYHVAIGQYCYQAPEPATRSFFY